MLETTLIDTKCPSHLARCASSGWNTSLHDVGTGRIVRLGHFIPLLYPKQELPPKNEGSLPNASV